MNLPSLFSDYRIFFEGSRIGQGWINVQCPWCDDQGKNGGFNIFDGYFSCWRCGWHNFEQTMARILSMPLLETRALLKGYEGHTMAVSRLNRKTPVKKSLELPGGGFTPAERDYLLKRRFNPSFLAEYYGIRGGGITGPWKFRIIIPFFLGGKPVSWTARSILPPEKLKEAKLPRYKQLAVEDSVFDPKRAIYNADHCPGPRLILLEGAFDVMRMGDNFACSFGTTVTHAQINYIAKNYSWVGVLFDAEKEAQKKAEKTANHLEALGVTAYTIDAFGDYGKKDAGELLPGEARKLRAELGF